MRVATFNVRGFRDGGDGVAEVVQAIEPDVLLVQETGSRRALRRFAAKTGMRAASDPWSPLRRRVKNAVLVREPLRLSSERLARFPDARRWYPRGVLVVRVDRDGEGGLWALSVHLGLGGDERGRQVEALLALIASLDGAMVLVGGDLNATPDMRAPSRLAESLRDAWAEVGEGDGETFPALAPIARIDYIFVGSGLRVRAAHVGSGGAHRVSDHLPVSVDLALAWE